MNNYPFNNFVQDNYQYFSVANVDLFLSINYVSKDVRDYTVDKINELNKESTHIDNTTNSNASTEAKSSSDSNSSMSSNTSSDAQSSDSNTSSEATRNVVGQAPIHNK